MIPRMVHRIIIGLSIQSNKAKWAFVLDRREAPELLRMLQAALSSFKSYYRIVYFR